MSITERVQSFFSMFIVSINKNNDSYSNIFLHLKAVEIILFLCNIIFSSVFVSLLLNKMYQLATLTIQKIVFDRATQSIYCNYASPLV